MMYSTLAEKKQRLDQFRPLPKALVKNLDDWFKVELTYTSNAIEGNTLTRRETALVVEKGLTVGGKTLKEHLEATNHAAALDWVSSLIQKKPRRFTLSHILSIHKIILKGIDNENAGFLRRIPVRISGSMVVLPNYKKVPDLMHEFVEWLNLSSNLHPLELAALAHYKLVTIHPFVDGNGRTARLLMNLILMMHGYPPVIIRTRDRIKYIGSLEKAQLGGSIDAYLKLIAAALDRSLDIYLNALEESPKQIIQEASEKALLKIGELAKEVGESTSTIRHWTQLGLLEAAEITPSGYQLYSRDMVKRIERIKKLKAQRYTLQEIKEKLIS